MSKKKNVLGIFASLFLGLVVAASVGYYLHTPTVHAEVEKGEKKIEGVLTVEVEITNLGEGRIGRAWLDMEVEGGIRVEETTEKSMQRTPKGYGLRIENLDEGENRVLSFRIQPTSSELETGKYELEIEPTLNGKSTHGGKDVWFYYEERSNSISWTDRPATDQVEEIKEKAVIGLQHWTD